MYLAAIFGPPPPDVRTLTLTAFIGWIVPFWAWWIDRHRELRS
jgi:hypothetical protein